MRGLFGPYGRGRGSWKVIHQLSFPSVWKIIYVTSTLFNHTLSYDPPPAASKLECVQGCMKPHLYHTGFFLLSPLPLLLSCPFLNQPQYHCPYFSGPCCLSLPQISMGPSPSWILLTSTKSKHSFLYLSLLSRRGKDEVGVGMDRERSTLGVSHFKVPFTFS